MIPKTCREASRNDDRRRIDRARGEGGPISSPEKPGDLSKDD